MNTPKKIVITVTRRADGNIEFYWDDKDPVCWVVVDRKGCVGVCLTDIDYSNYVTELVGDVDYLHVCKITE